MNNFLLSLLLVLNLCFYADKPLLTDEVVETPKLFDKYPAALHFQSGPINDLIGRKKDEIISVSCSENFAFKGVVTQNIQWNENAQTVAIKLDSFPADTKLVINRINKDGIIIFKGHIMNALYPDAYQLSSNGSSGFVFNKISREKIVTE